MVEFNKLKQKSEHSESHQNNHNQKMAEPLNQADQQPNQQVKPTRTSKHDDNSFLNRQTILFKISSLTYPVDLIPLEASTRHSKASQKQPP